MSDPKQSNTMTDAVATENKRKWLVKKRGFYKDGEDIVRQLAKGCIRDKLYRNEETHDRDEMFTHFGKEEVDVLPKQFKVTGGYMFLDNIIDEHNLYAGMVSLNTRYVPTDDIKYSFWVTKEDPDTIHVDVAD